MASQFIRSSDPSSVHPTYSNRQSANLSHRSTNNWNTLILGQQSIWNLMNLMACGQQMMTTQMTSPLGQVAMHANDIVATQDHGSEPATTPKTPKIPKIIAVIAATAWCLMFTCVSWCLLMLVVVWLYDYMAICIASSCMAFTRGLLESCMSRSCALHTIP